MNSKPDTSLLSGSGLRSVTLGLVLSCALTVAIEAGETTKVQIEVGSPQIKIKQGKGPPAHAPAHGYRRKFTYHYYPRAEVYHDVDRGLWFYTDGREWKAGARLPVEFGNDIGGHVTVELESGNPETEHEKTREIHREKES